MATLAAIPLARMAWRNVRKNWRHSLGTVLSIAVGFIAISLFDGYLKDVTRSQGNTYSKRNMFGDLIIQKKDGSSSAAREEPFKHALGREDQAFLEDYLGRRGGEVVARVRFLNLSGLASAGKTGVVFIGVGYDVKEGAQVRGEWAWNAIAGKPLQLASANAVLLGKGLGEILDCRPTSDAKAMGPNGAPIPAERPFACRQRYIQLTATTESGQLNVLRSEVAGLFNAGFKEFDSRLVLIPLEAARRLVDTEVVSMYSVLLANPKNAAPFLAELRAAAVAKGLQLEAMQWHEHTAADLYRRALDLIGAYRSLVALVVITIAGMSVLVTMMKSVSTRTREIGTLRSLGFLRRHIVALFALEAATLACLSSAVGLLAALGITWAINAAGISYKAGVLSEPIPLTVAYIPSVYVSAAVFLSIVAMIAALVPARRAARMSIPSALGHV